MSVPNQASLCTLKRNVRDEMSTATTSDICEQVSQAVRGSVSAAMPSDTAAPTTDAV